MKKTWKKPERGLVAAGLVLTLYLPAELKANIYQRAAPRKMLARGDDFRLNARPDKFWQ